MNRFDMAIVAIPFLEPVDTGPEFHVEFTADLPALGFSAGDRVTMTPQTRVDCDCRYLLRDQSFVRIQIYPSEAVRLVRQDGSAEIMSRTKVDSMVAARVRHCSHFEPVEIAQRTGDVQ